MEFEQWSDGEYSDYVKPSFAEMSKPPKDNFNEYRKVVEEGLADYRDVFGINVGFDVVIAETDIESAEDFYGDEDSYYAYINGMSAFADSPWHDRNIVTIRVTDKPEKWKSFLKSLVVHETAHLHFQENRDTVETIAHHMLMEGHAMHAVKMISQRKNYDWRQEWELPKIDVKKVVKELDKERSWNQNQSKEISTLFNYGGDTWPEAEGYTLSYHTTREIINRKNWDIRKLEKIKTEKWKKEIKKSLKNLYGDQ